MPSDGFKIQIRAQPLTVVSSPARGLSTNGTGNRVKGIFSPELSDTGRMSRVRC